jgi:hypothetical protein
MFVESGGYYDQTCDLEHLAAVIAIAAIVRDRLFFQHTFAFYCSTSVLFTLGPGFCNRARTFPSDYGSFQVRKCFVQQILGDDRGR